MLKNFKFLLFFLLILAILLNINWLKSPMLGLIFGLLYLLIFGYLTGKVIFKNKNFSWQVIIGTFSLFSAYSLLGAIIYYFYQLNQLSVSILFAVISIAIIILDFKSQISDLRIQHSISNLIKHYKTSSSFIKPLILILTYLILFATSVFILIQSQTTEAIKTPWQVIPPAFFIIYFIATLNLIILTFRLKNYLTNILISLHFFLTTGIALIIYKLGYGFDPFIHQITELTIFQNGLILPKPFYYLGQYSIVVFLAHLLQISVEWIDKLLLPILLSIFLPYTIYKSLNKTFLWPESKCRILTLVFLFLPFSLFIATTPQALANLFTIIILFLSFLHLRNKQIPFCFLIFLTLTTLFIHPLAGIPVFIYLIILWLLENKSKSKKIILIIFTLLSALALPLALLLNSLISIYKITIESGDFSLIELPTIFSKQFNYFLDLAYLYKLSIYWLFILTAALTFIYLVKQKKAKFFLASILTFIILIINAILLNFIKLSFIIDYEQGDFSRRVWQLAFYFLLPVVIYGFYLIINKASKQSSVYKIFIIFLLSGFITFSLYLSYPRFDDYDNSKFVNLSQNDLLTVEFIEKNAKTDYIVLANQMTSAAALKTFGFNRYYKGHYFYPIPTGGNLYQYFEKMIYEDTSKQTIIEAIDLTGVKTAYFVLPSYWSRFAIIAEQAKKSADQIFSLDDEIYIYKYFK